MDFTCSHCSKTLPLSEFYSDSSKKGHRSNCKACHNDDCVRRDREKKGRAGRRSAALHLLCGGTPACQKCGFADERALQIDHVDGGGTVESRKIGPAGLMARVFRGEGNYQVLCANCNTIKKVENGEVPGYLRDR